MDQVIDRLRAAVDRHEETLTDYQRRIGHLEVEEARTRQRLHQVENDRKAIRALVKTTQALAAQTRSLAAEVSEGVKAAEELAENVAEKAVAKAFAHERAETQRRKAGRWRTAGRLATHLTAIGGFGSLVSYLVAHFFG